MNKRITSMGAMTEWKTFAALAVEWLGMPAYAMPFYLPSRRWSRKAKYILNDILCLGQRKLTIYNSNPSYLKRKANSFWKHSKVGMRHFGVFPFDTVAIWWNMIVKGLKIVFLKS